MVTGKDEVAGSKSEQEIVLNTMQVQETETKDLSKGVWFITLSISILS